MLTVWRERAKDVRRQPIDCGHFLAEDAPEVTASEIFRFLDSVEAARSRC